VNLSGHSLCDDNFLGFVERQFDLNGVPHGRICFEITESAAITNLREAIHFIEAMKSKGCTFSLDDFGSGLSSFNYLKNLPVDYLKIDGAFVRDMDTDPMDEAMVEAIHRIGRVVGLRTIAECVESAAILERLKRIGVDYVQGDWLAAPVPLTDRGGGRGLSG
jgi:EAL domain-containing protein (putative c-di-GMP-specific phosphodiesterase class I)